METEFGRKRCSFVEEFIKSSSTFIYKGVRARSELSLPRVKGKQNQRLKKWGGGGVDADSVGETGHAQHARARAHTHTAESERC